MKQKVALVTGSTSGIGLACVRRFAERGVNVVVTGSREKLSIDAELTDLIQKHGVRVDYVTADLTQPSGVETIWTEVSQIYPDGVDVLVNNAGKLIRAKCLEELSDNLWDELIAINLTAAFKLTKLFLPGMKKKGRGRIVNVSSIAGVVATPSGPAYCATKHAMIGLTKGVALESAEHGITCNAVCPALTDTPMARQQNSATEVSALVNSAEKAGGRVPVIKPEQVAELVEFLCLSDASSQITGAVYLIDHGRVAS